MDEHWGNAGEKYLEIMGIKNLSGEFPLKELCASPSSPYYGWSWKKRDSFFYDLALAIGQKAVPVCGSYPFEKHAQMALDGTLRIRELKGEELRMRQQAMAFAREKFQFNMAKRALEASASESTT